MLFKLMCVMEQESTPKTWHEQLKDWYKNSGKFVGQISRETGIPRSTFGDYITGKPKDLSRMPQERINLLYNLTGLDCFKYEEIKIEMPYSSNNLTESPQKTQTTPYKSVDPNKSISDLIKQGKEGIERLVEQTLSNIPGIEKLKSGVLKAQLYNPSAKQRAEAIMELLDILAEEVDYFRTADGTDRDILIKNLQRNPESFGYVTQMLNVIYSGKKIDSWMLMSQPPSKIKKLNKKE